MAEPEAINWLPYQDTERPADLARCRFTLRPDGRIVVWAEDYAGAGQVYRWLVGQALQEKDHG